MDGTGMKDLSGSFVLARRLRADHDAPGAARALAQEMLVEVEEGLAERRDDLILSISELVANAVVHGPAGYLSLRISRACDTVLVEVGDEGTSSFRWPDFMDGDAHWGLGLVSTLCDRSGIDRRPHTVAWCEMNLAA